MYKNDEVICHCAGITYKEIKDAITKGATTVEEISDVTDAGIACGYCIEQLEEILENN